MAEHSEPAGFDEAAVRALLARGEAQIAEGLGLIDRHLRGAVCRRLRHRIRSLSAEDVEDAWAETLAALLRSAREGRLAGRGPLAAWLHRVARSRGADLYRRSQAREQALADLRRDAAAARSQGGAGLVEAGGEAAGLAALLATLPPRQRGVLRAFIDGFPGTAETEALRLAVSRATGTDESAASVKRALQEARSKARAWLRRGETPRRAG